MIFILLVNLGFLRLNICNPCQFNRVQNKNKNKHIYYSNQWAHNRGKQIAYIDYCHWRQLYIHIYIKMYSVNTCYS